jgi:hypothetical protein
MSLMQSRESQRSAHFFHQPRLATRKVNCDAPGRFDFQQNLEGRDPGKRVIGECPFFA